MSGVLSARVKSKVHKTVIRPAMIYGAEVTGEEAGRSGDEDVKVDVWSNET